MATPSPARLVVGHSVQPRELSSLHDRPVPLPDPAAIVHLQFRRFAACPVCSTHLREFVVRHDDLLAAGVREVVVFHSEAAEVRRYRADLPFDVVADPQRELYGDFGVSRGLGSVLHPRVAAAGLRGLAKGASVRGALDRREDHLGRPADFLISPDGVVRALAYGSHAADGWTVEDVLDHARVAAGAP